MNILTRMLRNTNTSSEQHEHIFVLLKPYIKTRVIRQSSKMILPFLLAILLILYFGLIHEKNTYDKKQEPVTIYIPDTSCFNYEGFKKHYPSLKVVTFAIYTDEKTYNEFKNKLREIESGNNYSSRRINDNGSPSQYLGAYQIGLSMRINIGLGDIPDSLFLATPSLQEAAMDLCILYNRNKLRPYLEKFEGKFVAGFQMTESSMLAIAHNAGNNALIKFLLSNGEHLPQDANGISYKFMRLSGYKLAPHAEYYTTNGGFRAR